MDDAEIRKRLDAVAHALRPVHKALVDLQQAAYERRHGERVRGPLHLYKLVTSDPEFAWILPLSAVMAEVDELYDQKEPIADDEVTAVRATIEALIGHSGQEPSPESFVSRYLEILQNEPDVVLVHARLRRALDQL
jgi:hypothetical protein